MATLPEITDPPRKRPGRKPGCERIPGSGRKPGVKNKVPRDLKEMILARGKPLELLCDISRGVKIRVGPQAGPGAAYVYPSLAERAAAAKILCDKLIAAAQPASSDGADGQPLHPPISDEETARRICFVLAKARKASAKDEADGTPTLDGRQADPSDLARAKADLDRIVAEPFEPTPVPPEPEPIPFPEARPAPIIHTPVLLRRAND
jgi:hypothetical protein